MVSGTLDLLGGLARPSSDPPLRPQTPASSQLTIFYSGTVNVYNDVPADKVRLFPLCNPSLFLVLPSWPSVVCLNDVRMHSQAHAIMLLLANGDEKHSRGTDVSIVGAPTPMISRTPVGTSSTFKQPLSMASTPPPLSPFQASQPLSPFQASQPERKPQLINKRTQAGTASLDYVCSCPQTQTHTHTDTYMVRYIITHCTPTYILVHIHM